MLEDASHRRRLSSQQVHLVLSEQPVSEIARDHHNVTRRWPPCGLCILIHAVDMML